jgi:hypothetical protein
MHEQARYRDEEIISRLKTIQAHVALQRQGSFGGETLRDYDPEETGNIVRYSSAGTRRASEFVNDPSSPIGQCSASVRSSSFAAISPRTSLSTSTGITTEDEITRLSVTSSSSFDRKELESAVRAGRVDKVKDIIGRVGDAATVGEARRVSSHSISAK